MIFLEINELTLAKLNKKYTTLKKIGLLISF